MVKLVKITFEYEDGSTDIIDDPRNAALYQSRCNSAGVLSGIEDFVIHKDAPKEEDKSCSK